MFATTPIHVAGKHTVVGLTKAEALELAKRNIGVNAVLPCAVGSTGTLERSSGGNPRTIRPPSQFDSNSEAIEAIR